MYAAFVEVLMLALALVGALSVALWLRDHVPSALARWFETTEQLDLTDEKQHARFVVVMTPKEPK